MMSDISEENTIPKIVLSTETSTYSGSLGSYCWNNICVDQARPSSRTDIHEKVVIQNGSRITFNLEGFVKPEKFHINVFSGENIVLNLDVEDQMMLNLQKGLYFLNVMASWMYKGDVSYVFLIEVT